MSGFHEVSLPLAWALGARGGPTRRTSVVTLGSGAERRATPWAQGRRRYDLGGAVMSPDQLAALISFFEARQGRLWGFRFRDALDWKSCPPSATPGPLDQLLGQGDGVRTVFPLRKAYSAGEHVIWRSIVKPVAGSVVVAVDGQVVSETGYSVDPATGVVTLTNPPPANCPVTAGFVFDTPVRFDADALEVTLDSPSAGRVVSAPLIEIQP